MRNEIADWLQQSKSRTTYFSAVMCFLLGAGDLMIFFTGGGPFNRWVDLVISVFLLLWAPIMLSHAVGLRKDEEKRKRLQ